METVQGAESQKGNPTVAGFSSSTEKLIFPADNEGTKMSLYSSRQTLRAAVRRRWTYKTTENHNGISNHPTGDGFSSVTENTLSPKHAEMYTRRKQTEDTKCERHRGSIAPSSTNKTVGLRQTKHYEGTKRSRSSS